MSLPSRGVQYVHWVMHKCIMVKVGGKRNTQKVCKKQVNFAKTEREIVESRGNNNFRETEGMYWNRENRGIFEICDWWLEKKVIRHFETEKIFGKRSNCENFPQSLKILNFSKMGGGNLKQREMHHGLMGDGRLWTSVKYYLSSVMAFKHFKLN